MHDLGHAAGDKMPWKLAGSGRTVFRLVSPIIIWWGWVAFAVITVALVAIPGHNYASAELAAGLAAVTAIVYATTLRPSVTADEDGVSVCNPLHDHRIGWGGISDVYLGDMVEFSCARRAPRQSKTIYCWALYSSRRARLRARMRTARSPSPVFGYARAASAGDQQPSRPDTVEVMAAELRRQLAAARERDVPAAFLESTWAWRPAAYIVAPAAILLALLLAR